MGLLDILYVQSALRSIVLKLPSAAWPDTICMPWKCLRGIYLDTHARTHERKWYLQNIYVTNGNAVLLCVCVCAWRTAVLARPQDPKHAKISVAVCSGAPVAGADFDGF